MMMMMMIYMMMFYNVSEYHNDISADYNDEYMILVDNIMMIYDSSGHYNEDNYMIEWTL